MADDNTKDGSGGFDEWLEEKPGPSTDPYEQLSEDDAGEIADWMAFTEGGQTSDADELDPVEPVAASSKSGGDAEGASDAGKNGQATGEIEMRDLVSEGGDVSISDDEDDTGELEIISTPSQGAYSEDPSGGATDSRELFDLDQTDYLSTATTEHQDLAEAIAVASTQDTEQVPISAPIPGMADSTVGFEDVVEAEGIGRVRARASGDLVARVITAAVLIVALGASLVWRPALVVLALAVFVLGAGEFYTSLVRADHKPIGLFGFAGIIGASVGAFLWGALAIPVAFFLAIAMLLLFYAVVPGKVDPLGNLALTITVMVWVGLGSFTMLIAVSDSYRPLVIGVVVTVAAMDIGQYFIGRAIGRTQLSPWVSPKKTVEGLIAGIFIAMVVGALLHFVEPFELTSGLALGAAVAILAPLGDLAMSAAKRSLGLKDMGSVLPGHGGFLDRIDGILFVVPAAWVIFEWAGIL